MTIVISKSLAESLLLRRMSIIQRLNQIILKVVLLKLLNLDKLK